MSVFICMYVYIYILLSDKVISDISCGGIIAYAGEWHDKVPGLMGIKWEE